MDNQPARVNNMTVAYLTHNRLNDPQFDRWNLKRVSVAMRTLALTTMLAHYNTIHPGQTNSSFRQSIRSFLWALATCGTTCQMDYEDMHCNVENPTGLRSQNPIQPLIEKLRSLRIGNEYLTIRRFARSLDIIAYDVIKNETTWAKPSHTMIRLGVPKAFFYLAFDFADDLYPDCLTDPELSTLNNILITRNKIDANKLLVSNSAVIHKGKLPYYRRR